MRERLNSAFFSALRATATLGRSAPRGSIEGERTLVSRALAGLRVGLWSAIGTALSADEKSRLGVALYDAADEYRDSPRHAWEDAWHARWLPIPQRASPTAHEGEGATSCASEGATSRASEGATPREGEGRTSRAGESSTSRAIEGRTPREGASSTSRASGGPTPRVLVGAAGAGREVLALLDRGLDVIALEPSPALAALCRSRTTGRAHVIEARYEDLCSPDFFGFAELARRADADRTRIETPRGARFDRGLHVDAVLLGLGSLSHVLDAAARARLFEALVRACPRGPILASALTPPRGVSLQEAPRGGRASRMGRALARPLRAARRLPPIEPGEVVFDALGFVRLFTHDELRALGASCGRRTIFDDGAPDGMALCTFLPA